MISNNQIKQKSLKKTAAPPTPPKMNPVMTLPILADLIRHENGTYLLRPRVMDTDLDSWLTVKKAGQIIGIGSRSIYRLIDAENPFLVHKRPLKGFCLISLRSIQAYIKATNDPEFWENSAQQKKLSESVQKANGKPARAILLNSKENLFPV